MRTGVDFKVSDGQRGRLEAIADGGNSKVKHARRARIILLTDDGLGTMAVAEGAGVTKATVWRWQERFMEAGVEGLLRDKTRKPGTPRTSEETVRELVDLAARPAPDGETHWTVRALAKKVGIGASTAHGILAAHRLAPHRVRQFKVSTDPKFAEKTREVIWNPLCRAAIRILLVVQRDELFDRRLEILEGIMDAAPEPAVGQLPEEALDRVRPGAGGRREMEGPAGMVLQPLRGTSACGRSSQDGADLPPGGRRLSICSRNAMNSWCRWRSEWRPMTVPSRMSVAAKSVVVPFRL